MTQVVFDVSAFIYSRHVGAVQYGITILCGLMMFLDGFDTQAISYMAPLIAKEWGLSREVLGPIFSSALTGLMVGYLRLSARLSDPSWRGVDLWLRPVSISGRTLRQVPW
jgi:AAHS family 4-hydroxybenzoate transporter-like MFS transporter